MAILENCHVNIIRDVVRIVLPCFFRNQIVVKLAIVKNNIMANRKMVWSTRMA